jgi:hypothetical protein
MDGDDAIRALAEKIDAAQPFATSVGTAGVVLSNVALASATVTFPVGRFTQAPRANATVRGTSVWFSYLANNPSTASMSVGVRKYDGTPGTATVNVDWTAVQMLATSADG